MAAATSRHRIVPTGPESFVDELLRIDDDFFGAGYCDDCEQPDHHHDLEQDDDDLRPVLVVGSR